MTLNSYTNCLDSYEVTLNTCTCKGFQHWGHCKHIETLQRAYERARRATFEDMRQQFDCRLNGQEHTAYLNYCVQLGI